MKPPVTHRAAVRDEASDPTREAASMLSEGWTYPADTPSHVEVLVTARQMPLVDHGPILAALLDSGAHPHSTVTVRVKPPKEVHSL